MTLKMTRIFFLLTSYLFLTFAYIFTKGFFSFPGAFIILLSYFLLLASLNLKKNKPASSNNITNFSRQILLIFFILSFLLYGGMYQIFPRLVFLSQMLLFISLGLYTVVFLNLNIFSFLKKHNFSILVLIAITLRAFMIISSPSPYIDVFEKLTQSAKLIIFFKSPYQLIFPQMYKGIIPDAFVHLPAVFLFLTPSFYLFSDIRFAYLLFDLLVALLIAKKLNFKKDNSSLPRVFSLLYLYNPISLFVLEQSWLEPLLLGLIFLTVYFYHKKTNYYPLTYGILLATKTIITPGIFYFSLLKKFNFRKMLTSVLIASFLILPVAAIGFNDFLADIFFAFFSKSRNSAPIKIALTFPNLLKNLTGIDYLKIKSIKILILIQSLILFYLPLIITKFKKVSPSKLLHLLAAAYLGFYFFAFQAFCNYYYFVNNLILFSIVFYSLKPTNHRKER